MSKILDLNLFTEETFDIRLPADGPKTGKLLHLRKPTREMTIKMMDFKNLKQNAKSEVIIERLDSMTYLILNSNNANDEISADYVAQTLTMPMKQAVITAYAAWIVGIEQSPN